MQVSKAVPPETSAKTGSCAVDSDPAVLSLTRTNSNAAGQQISGLQQNPDPSLTPLCSNTTAAVCSSSASDGLHGVVEHTQSEQAQAKGAVCESVGKAGISGNSAAAATDVGPIISSYSGRAACASGTSPLPGQLTLQLSKNVLLVQKRFSKWWNGIPQCVVAQYTRC